MVRRHLPLWVIEIFPTVLGCALIMAAFTFGVDNSPLAFLGLALASIIILGFRDMALFGHWQRKRRGEMKHAAERLQFSFRESSRESLLGWPESFQLARNQEARKFTNIMEAPVGQTRVMIFDFECDQPNSEGPASRQTVFVVKSSDFEHPPVGLLPARWFDRLIGRFRDAPATSTRLPSDYRLIDDCGVVETLGWRLSSLLDGRISVEAGAGMLLVYRKDKLVQPDQIEVILRQGLEIYSAFRDATIAQNSSASRD